MLTPRSAKVKEKVECPLFSVTWTHALEETSDAIDAGSNAVAMAYGLLRDQRGLGRFVDFDEDDEEHVVDIGTLELAFDEVYA
jgi:hypothetical protein